jgi:hypothetical protein
MANSLPLFLIKKEVNMIDEVFLPKIFAFCRNFNTPGCSKSEDIQEELYSKIELLEVKNLEDPDAVDIGKIMVDISKNYCYFCSDFFMK